MNTIRRSCAHIQLRAQGLCSPKMYLHCSIFFLVFFVSVQNLNAAVYVSPTGSDTNSGTFEKPFRTIPRAVSVLAANDTIWMRGGTYTVTATISISKKGSTSAHYCLFAYADERPLLDFSSMAVSSSNRGINFSGWYWHVKGIDIKGAGDNGMNLSGSNNTIEFCSFFENRDTGLQLSGGASNNSVINCDSYYNADPLNGNADGFAPKLDVGTGNYFFGCRSWQNSDDGTDGYMRGANDVTTVFEQCWIFKNGYLKSGLASTGNGNGFKMGGSDDKTLRHNVVLKKCIAFDNRVKGFDQNNNKGSMTLYNCTGYRNGTNYGIGGTIDSGKTLTVKNCVAIGAVGTIMTGAVQEKNSWMPPFIVTESDFKNLLTEEAYRPRKSDGSLPDMNFMHLADSSDLIDGGVVVGLPYAGIAPDLGAFESGEMMRITDARTNPYQFHLEQNYPNPFNASTVIQFTLAEAGDVSLKVYSLVGELVETLFRGDLESGQYRMQFHGDRHASGTYIFMLRQKNTQMARKLVLVK